MNSSKIAIIAALGFLAVPDGANAAPLPNNGACNALQTAGGMSTVYSHAPWETDVTPHCINTYDISNNGQAVTSTYAVKPRLDEDGNQVIEDGHPLVFQAFGYDHVSDPVAEVHGINGIAIGNGARVGQWIKGSCTSGVLNSSGTGCQISDTDSTPVADAFVPAHAINVDNGTAIGAGAVVEHNNSTAIGAGAKSTDTNQVTLGTKDETIRAEGITSQKSKDRQVGPTELVTSDSGGRLATDGGQTFARIGSLEGGLSDAQQAISANTALLSQHSAKLDTLSKGVAIAMSLPDAWIEANKRFSIAGNIGGFDGETALGFAAALRLDETWSINGKLGADTSFDEFGWTVGARASW